ncbi:hypothetical protein HDU93_006325 [Gonapodya sp. JEL0774]|nr:hypothetical protein HDU93_006325 [Gonapodya sp. JEL0774]
MVGVLILVGRGLEPPSLVSSMLDPTTFHLGRPTYTMAPPEGLVLVGAGYDGWGLNWRTGAKSESGDGGGTRGVDNVVWSGWRDYATRAAVWGGLAREIGAGLKSEACREVKSEVGGDGGVCAGVAALDYVEGARWGETLAKKVEFGAWNEDGFGGRVGSGSGGKLGKKGKAFVPGNVSYRLYRPHTLA